MNPFNTPCNRRSKEVLAGVALLLLGLLFTPVPNANGEALPVFRQGNWVFNRTMAGRSMEVRRCTDPNENILQKGECKFSSIEKSGNIYRFTADCPEEIPSSPRLGGRTSVVLDVKSDSFYQALSEKVVDGQTVKEYLDARRKGDCNP
ncbi:MAG: hypothetical protein CVU57_02730 [Deltaproteobacteria bacterium HGW-Deltaproteobacteria-15]|jgi:hypothetical protein|nr:MAG: hypothetical protein CVU57_02730 [Deltaproteobacteria bacterium HGW-Deltaproteobacteria-15]